MSMKKPVEPQVTQKPSDPVDSYVERHPAYAVIGASRITYGAYDGSTAGTYLFGSDFRHRNSVRIVVMGASVSRGLSHDWPHGDLNRQYVELEMSEAQWAAFVSTLNVGDGVQCTVRYVNGEEVPGIARIPDRAQQFSGEAKEHLLAVEKHLAQLRQTVEDSKLSAKAKDDLLSLCTRMHNDLTPNIDYVGKAFAEHVERTTERAKIEVNAHIQNTLVRAGMKALGGAAAESPLLIGEASEEEE